MQRWHGMLFYNGRMEFWDVVRNKIQDIKVLLKMLKRTMDGNRRPPKEPKTPKHDDKPAAKKPATTTEPKGKPRKPKVDISQRPPLITNPIGKSASSKKPKKVTWMKIMYHQCKRLYNLRKRKPSAAAGSARDLWSSSSEDEEPTPKRRRTRTSQRAAIVSSPVEK